MLWWESTVPVHWIQLWRVWCMPSSLKTKRLNRMRHTGWYKLRGSGRSGGGQNRISPMGNHLSGYQSRMHTPLISNGLRTRKRKYRRLWSGTLHGVLQERGGYIDGSQHVSQWYWETPRIRMTCLDNGTMNEHSILGWILRFPDGHERHFCQCLSRNRQSIPNLTKTKHQTRSSCMYLKVIQAPCLVHLLQAVLFCPLPGQVRHLKWWLTKFFADHLDIFYMYSEMGNNERTEIQLKFQDLPIPSVFVTTPKVGGTGLNLTAANHAVITQKFWVLNEQQQAFARAVRLGQNRVPHTCLLNTGPNCYDNRASDLHQLSGVAQMGVLYGLMSRPNIMTTMIYLILGCW